MSGPERLGAILKRWRPAGGAPAGDPASIIAAHWVEAVGADVGRRTRPGRLRDGVLTVYTTGSAWSHQLSFLAPVIKDALLERCPGVPLQRLRFIIASGRTRALLDASPAATQKRAQRPGSGSAGEAIAPFPESDDIESIIGRLRSRQRALDRERERNGWLRCGRCASWRPPRGADACGVCAEENRRTKDGRIERVLSDAPWLRAHELEQLVPHIDVAAFERVRRRLAARWEEQLFAARRRLRRGELQAADRITAWSYVMLRASMRQRNIGRAVVADVLDEQWAQALFDAPQNAAQSSIREASARSREKAQNMSPRV